MKTNFKLLYSTLENKIDNCGVYAIKSKIDERLYIGSSINIKRRLYTHTSDLANKRHPSYHLQKFYNKYGPESLKIEVLESCPIQNLILREQYWMDLIKNRRSRKLLFNSCLIAGSRKGYKPSKYIINLRKKRRRQKRDLEIKQHYEYLAYMYETVFSRGKGCCELCGIEVEKEDSIYTYNMYDIKEGKHFKKKTLENTILLCPNCRILQYEKNICILSF